MTLAKPQSEHIVSRNRISLDGEWEFYPDPQQRLTPETLRPDDARRIRVPGPWQAQFDDLRDYTGVAWYRRHFEADGRTGGPIERYCTIRGNVHPTA